MQKMSKNILVLGSGLMADAVVSHLLLRKENKVHIASNIIEDAKKIVDSHHAKQPDSCTYGPVNVTDKQSLGPLVKSADIVISYVPAFLHIHVAKVCIIHKKHLVTASYVSPEMQALKEQVKNSDLIFLNELGLDPGIDHLATMKIIDQVTSNGGKIVEYESWCGGLPSIAHKGDNPIGYKFSWSPISSFLSLVNAAVFIEESKQVQVQAKDLLYYGKTLQLDKNLRLEGYPNRNSVSYKDIYNLKDAHKVLRGTLRYPNFCEFINALKEIGMLDKTPVKGQKWVEYFGLLLENQPGNTLEEKIQSRCVEKVKHYDKLSNEEKKQKGESIIASLSFFKLLSGDSKVIRFLTQLPDPKCNNMENVVKQLEPYLALKEGETDLIAMQHIFVIEHKDGKKSRKKSSMIKEGTKNGASAMSLTVGTPTAIGAQLILDGKISERGVLRPVYPDIYNPVLEELAKVGIELVEEDEDL